MTEREAKEMLESYMECNKRKNNVVYEKRCHEDCDNCELCYVQGTVGEHKEAVNMAIKALEKHIPKRPDYEGDGYADGQLVYDYAKCPICGHDFEYGINDWECEYCSECGQKLDWSDEE